MTRIVTIVCWSVTAIALIGLALWFLFGAPLGSLFSFGIGGIEVIAGPYELDGTYTARITGVDSLKIDWIAGNVTVEPYDGADIELREYAQRALDETERLSVVTSGGMVTVKFRSGSEVRRMPPKKLEVLVPRTLCASFDGFFADSTSGGLLISGVGAVTFNAETTSGGIELNGISAKTLDCDSTSGSIRIKGAESDTISLSSASGSITVSDTRAAALVTDSTSGTHKLSGSFDSAALNSISGTVTLENSASGSAVRAGTTSGTQNLSGSFDSAALNSVSGSIKLRSELAPSSLEADTTSGSVAITIPYTAGITVSCNSISGKLSSDIPVVTQNSGARFRFSTTSGSVKLLALD